MVVSRWFVIPIARQSFASKGDFSIASFIDMTQEFHIVSGSCSTNPGLGYICGISCEAVATTSSSVVNTIALDDVVPWSIARIKPFIVAP
jgi:hypothetical protein